MVEDDMDFEWKKKINKSWFHPLIDHIRIIIHDCHVINLVIIKRNFKAYSLRISQKNSKNF